MIKKVSDHICDILAAHGIDRVFLVPSGGTLHLNISYGHDDRIKCLFNHHEQAASIAAESYARMQNKPAVVSVGSGSAAANAITGVLCAWTESYPMVVISGHLGDEKNKFAGSRKCDIAEMAKPITKYSEIADKPEEVPYHIEKAIYIATHGRRGPVWIDIPLDVQCAQIDTDNIKRYSPDEDTSELPPKMNKTVCGSVIEKIKNAKRPLLFVGAGMRSADAYEEFLELVDLLGIPVVNGMSSVDSIWYDHPLFVGRSSVYGSRAGNFAVQNADVLLSIGSRQSLEQTGPAYEKWAREAYTILNDIDPEELKKHNLHVNKAVAADAKVFIKGLIKKLKRMGVTTEKPLFDNMNWLLQCMLWKEKYPVVTPEEKGLQEDGKVNIYYFYDQLSIYSREKDVIVVDSGTSRIAGSQALRLKENQRFIANSAVSPMGYGLPAAIGACIATGGRPVTVIIGEGSLMTNLQELQTIITNKLPIRILVINNGEYQLMRQLEKDLCVEQPTGIGPESGNMGFPDIGYLSTAMGFVYCCCESNEEVPQFLADLEQEYTFRPQPMICEVKISSLQDITPRTFVKMLESGQIVTSPLEDMAPLLPREELIENMIIPLAEDGTDE